MRWRAPHRRRRPLGALARNSCALDSDVFRIRRSAPTTVSAPFRTRWHFTTVIGAPSVRYESAPFGVGDFRSALRGRGVRSGFAPGHGFHTHLLVRIGPTSLQSFHRLALWLSRAPLARQPKGRFFVCCPSVTENVLLRQASRVALGDFRLPPLPLPYRHRGRAAPHR